MTRLVPILAAALLLLYCVVISVRHKQQAIRIKKLEKKLLEQTLIEPQCPEPQCPRCACNADMDLIDPVIRQNNDRLPRRASNVSAAELCESSDACLPAFPSGQNFTSMIRVSSRNKLMSCFNHKSMSTIMTAVMCYLSDPKAFRESGHHFITESNGGFCQKNAYQYVSEMEINEKVTKEDAAWRYAFVTREPVDRFISGFIDRCIRTPLPPFCNGCHQNMTCFILSEYDRFTKQINEESYPETFEDVHFFPQHWRCDMQSNLGRYDIIRYSSDPSRQMMSDLMRVLERQNVTSSERRFIRDEITAGRTGHSTIQSKARTFLYDRLTSSPFLLEYIVRMFYHDFKMFNYKLPEGF